MISIVSASLISCNGKNWLGFCSVYLLSYIVVCAAATDTHCESDSNDLSNQSFGIATRYLAPHPLSMLTDCSSLPELSSLITNNNRDNAMHVNNT
jgi:hypothetical protein